MAPVTGAEQPAIEEQAALVANGAMVVEAAAVAVVADGVVEARVEVVAAGVVEAGVEVVADGVVEALVAEASVKYGRHSAHLSAGHTRSSRSFRLREFAGDRSRIPNSCGHSI